MMIVLLITNRYNYEKESLLKEEYTLKQMISLLTPFSNYDAKSIQEKK
jgi:hypothetical protein